MKETEYVLKGTVEEIANVLQKDFKMSRSEAKFFIYAMADYQRDDAVNVESKEMLDAWYLEKHDSKYEGQIPYTHLVINFSTVAKKLCHLAYEFLVQYFFSKNIDLVTIGSGLVYDIISSIQKVKDENYCVYARIIELCIGNRDRLIDINEIITANRDGKCDYLDSKWKCPYLKKYENCDCKMEEIQKALNKLTEQNILKKIGERWQLVH